MKLLLTFLLLSFPSAFATSTYEYGQDEYVTIATGASPDGKYTITAHAARAANTVIYLAEAANGKKIGPLEESGQGAFDTGADAFAAIWSKDSQQVTIVWRVDRHAPLRACTYKIENRRATALKGGDREATDAETKYWGKHQESGKIYGTPLPKKDGE